MRWSRRSEARDVPQAPLILSGLDGACRGGMLSLCLLLCAQHSLRAAHLYRPAFLLSALGVMIAGLGFWLLNGGSRRLSMVAMLMATLLLVTGIVLIFVTCHRLRVLEKSNQWLGYHLTVTDQRQYREHRCYQHAVLPLPAVTQCEIGQIPLGGMDALLLKERSSEGISTFYSHSPRRPIYRGRTHDVVRMAETILHAPARRAMSTYHRALSTQ
jgi:hypothetical protein